MLPASVADIDFRGSLADEFIEFRLFAFRGTQDASEPLHVFARAAAARNDNSDSRFGNVDAFVQNFAGDEDAVFTGTETVEELFALAGLCFVRYDGEAEVVADGVRGVIVGGENNGAFRFVADQNVPDRFEFAFAAAGDCALAQIGFKRGAPARTPGGHHDELVPAVARLEIDAVCADESGIDFACSFVFFRLFRGERNRDAVRLVRRKDAPLNLVNENFADQRPDKAVDHGFAAVVAFGRCCEAKAVWRKTHGGGKAVDGTRQVMAFIVNDDSEAVPDVFHHDDRGIVGADGDVANLFRASAEHSDFHSECALERGGPLLNQVDCRRDHQSGTLDRKNREHGEKALARACRHDDESASLRFEPGVERFCLMRHGLEPVAERKTGQFCIRFSAILNIALFGIENAQQRRVIQSVCTPKVYALIKAQKRKSVTRRRNVSEIQQKGS